MAGKDYHRRTAITRLSVPADRERLLHDTVEAWKRGCQIAVDKAWNRCSAKSDVQQLAYDAIRDQTDLGSQHAILATHQAAENIRSCLSRREEGRQASKPTYTSPTVRYDSRTMTVFDDGTVSLTVAGDHSRVRCDLVLPDDENGYQRQYLDEEWEPTESTLHYRNGDWFLHLGFRRPQSDTEAETTENGTVLGVDLGVEQIAVTSTARFFSAGELNHRRREFERVRGDLQANGSRSAHRTIESVSGREDEYVKHVLHSVANEIVAEAVRFDCDGIVFEELAGIRDRTRYASWHAEWAYERLVDYVEYKAEFEGLFVDTVGPRNTSRRCAECGHVDEANRSERDTFDCRSCTNRNHADYNAAKNVAAAYLRRGQQSSRRRGVSRYALKSGTVTACGSFSPYESTDKSFRSEPTSLE